MNTARLSLLITLGMCIIALAGCGNIETCEELAPHIIELSEQNADSYPGKILKIYDIREVSGTNELDCSATARMSRGGDTTIKFYIEEDADGDRFIYYQAR